MPRFIFSHFARKRFKKLSPEVQQRLTKKLVSYREHPEFLDLLEPLVDFEPATHRLRVGDYRFVLNVKSANDLLVLDVGHRKNIYK